MRELLAAGIMSLLATMSGVNVGSSHHHSGVSIDVDSDEVATCDDMSVRFDHEKAVKAQEELNVGDLRALKIVSEDHGGVRVVGWNQPRYAVTACKAAATDSTLRDVRVRLNGNEVSASGPEGEQWVVFYLVHAPQNATLDLNTHNGPIAVRDVTGTIAAHAVNGPISVKQSNGSIDLNTVNGPIAYSGTSGTVKLNATNGPIAVKLSSAQWNGSIDGHSQNGPIALKVPHDFNSRVTITSDGSGPIACHSDLCRAASRALRESRQDDGDSRGPRTITFGSGSGNISLTTVNGPIGVKELDD